MTGLLDFVEDPANATHLSGSGALCPLDISLPYTFDSEDLPIDVLPQNYTGRLLQCIYKYTYSDDA